MRQMRITAKLLLLSSALNRPLSSAVLQRIQRIQTFRFYNSAIYVQFTNRYAIRASPIDATVSLESVSSANSNCHPPVANR
jgi:hypothetical protein